jgi:hypothetical protein
MKLVPGTSVEKKKLKISLYVTGHSGFIQKFRKK